ncbi:MAG: glycosyltransferase [Alphaproteobacteria bacterium]|nr:glycosyltransferase [Alphaproteobacteria bacterium]
MTHINTDVPEISVVIPVYNEQDGLHDLFQRLLSSMDSLNRSYEIILTNDGSIDRSFEYLAAFQRQHADKVRIIDFLGNFGQHMAIIAGFEHSRGSIIVTLDADLQNPPEEIGRLISEFDKGFDYVGSYRANRQDTCFRKYVSRIINWIREKLTNIKMRDQGCMLRVYGRNIVDKIIESKESSTFIPALAYHFSQKPTEIQVQHNERAYGESKYSLYMLARLNFDLITGFSLAPLQLFTLFGICISILSGLFSIYMIGRRIYFGPELEGGFTLLTIVFFLLSVLILGVGLIGEYVGRIFQAVSKRPRYVIRTILEGQKHD